MFRSSSNLYIWLILMQYWRWHKVKVSRSKVKVNNAIMWKNCHGYKSQRDDWILIKLIHRIDIDTLFKIAKRQGHKVKVITLYLKLLHYQSLGRWKAAACDGTPEEYSPCFLSGISHDLLRILLEVVTLHFYWLN